MHLVEAVLINWKRPSNVKRIVQALKNQTIPVTITICDCNPDPLFSLDEETISMVDRIYRWTHNLGAFSRYTPMASYDHPYTFLIDDDLLPGEKCVETFLRAAIEMPEFGVLGQFGRILDNDLIFRPREIPLTSSFTEVDFIVRAYFVKTRHLYNITRFRWEIGYFEEAFPEDDLLLCASLKHYENRACYLIPFNGDAETLVCKEELGATHALSTRTDHYYKRREFVKRLMYYGWKPINNRNTGPGMSKVEHVKNDIPRVSVCMIVLNESEYITYAIEQIYNWSCCHEIIIVEGAVDLYPKENLSTELLSGDGTTELIKNFPDPDKKIKYVSGTFRNKVEQRNEYAKHVTGTHVLVLDADEFYTLNSLEKLKEDIVANPDIDLFSFNVSHDAQSRTYFHLWHGFNTHVIGGYWDVPHNRIYKWVPGTIYQGEDHNHPVRPDGVKLYPQSVFIRCAPTRAVCVHVGFAKEVTNQRDKNDYYVNRGEGKEPETVLRNLRQMYIDCRRACECWQPGRPLPHGASLFPYEHTLPEALLKHPRHKTT